MKGFTQNINRVNSIYDVNKKGTIVDPGPYEAIIMSNSDTLRTGRMFVYIPAFGGPQENTNSWVPVQYATPFYGKTDKNLIDKQEQNGLHSYGMWMTVPDPGVKVVVSFIEGNRDKGVVIGCLIDDVTNRMVPGLPSSKNWIKSPEVADYFPNKQPGIDFMPVLEHNPKIKRDEYALPENYARPVNMSLAVTLDRQGLLGDNIRGQSFSTAQRENNSSVFGVSTPGRPLTKDPADNPALKSRMSNQTATAEDLEIPSRKPGHMFVMDDGDIDGSHQMIRMRTSTGHQIMMNDSEGIIYVATASGNAWIELNNHGDIDIYSNGSFSMHTEGDFNIHAGGDINMEASGGINVSAMGINGIKAQAADGNIDMYSSAGTQLQTGGSTNIKSAGNHRETANEIHMNSDDQLAVEANTPTRYDLSARGNNTVEQSTSNRVPEHEPWNHTDTGQE